MSGESATPAKARPTRIAAWLSRLRGRLACAAAPFAESLLRSRPGLARSPLGTPLRHLLVGRMARAGLFDVYRMEHVGDVSSADTAIADYLAGPPCPELLAPLADPERYRARFGLPPGADLPLHYAARLPGDGRGPAMPGGFDAQGYLDQNPDIARTRQNPTAHFLWRGHAEARFMAEPAAVPSGPLPDFADVPLRPRGASRACVIIPVHNARHQTLSCLHSVLTAPCRTAHRVLVIDDASDDAELVRELARLEQRGLIERIRNARNAGFAATVNVGLARLEAGEDAVLLNSDTLVHNDWLDRLLATAASRPRVGTVTPMSSSATILSYPVVLRDNPRPLEIGWGPLDTMVRSLDHAPLAIPTAVGSCMLITAACLQDTGLLDAAAFPAGYGEENDFCCRATARGWRHLAAANTLIYHQGAASFSTRRAALVEAGLAVVHRRHPGYRQAVADHIAADPLAPLREQIDCQRVLHAAPRRTLWHWLGPTPPGFAATDLRLYKRADGLLRLHCPAVPVTPNLPDIKLPRDKVKLLGLLRAMGVQGVRLGDRSWLGGTFASLAEVAVALGTGLD